MNYFVKSNIKFDGEEYKKGDVIIMSEDQADSLLKDGIISIDEVEKDTEVVDVIDTPVVEKENKSISGDSVQSVASSNTGEPALDNSKTTESGISKDAEDVTPKVEEEKGFFGKMFGGANKESEEKTEEVVDGETVKTDDPETVIVDPENDPSKDL